MKLGLIVGALATALGAVACGGNGSLVTGGCEPDDTRCVSAPSGGGSSSSGSGASREAGAAVNEAGDEDAGGQTGGGRAEAGGSPGLCIPGNACGGLWACNDDCYTDKCCSLACSCTDSTGQSGTLECSLACP